MITYLPGLETAAQALDEKLNETLALRENEGITSPTPRFHLTWTSFPNRDSIPILLNSPRSEAKEALERYFSIVGTIAENEDEAAALLTTDEDVGAIVRSGRDAYRRFDPKVVIDTLDTMQIIETQAHNDSMPGRMLTDQLDAYYYGRHTIPLSERELYAEFVPGIAQDLLTHGINYQCRVESILQRFGKKMTFESSKTSAHQFAFTELMYLLDIPHVITEEGLMIADEKGGAAISETHDSLNKVASIYQEPAKRTITNAFEANPALIAFADQYAKTPGEWIKMLFIGYTGKSTQTPEWIQMVS